MKKTIFTREELYELVWNQGTSPDMKEEWEYVENPIEYIKETNGLTGKKISGTQRTFESTRDKEKELSKERSTEIKNAVHHDGEMHWSEYSHT